MSLSPLQLRRCKQVIKEIRRYSISKIFQDPVDPEALGIPDYHRIITHPMDLSTVLKNLNDNMYKSIDAWKSDVNLIWSNAVRYNRATSYIGVSANYLKEIFRGLTEFLTEDPVADWTNELQKLQSNFNETIMKLLNTQKIPEVKTTPAPTPLPPVHKNQLNDKKHRNKTKTHNVVNEVHVNHVEVQPKIVEVQPKIVEIQPKIIEVQPKIVEIQPKIVEIQPKIVEIPKPVEPPKPVLSREEMEVIVERVNNVEDDDLIAEIEALIKKNGIEPTADGSEISIEELGNETLLAIKQLLDSH